MAATTVRRHEGLDDLPGDLIELFAGAEAIDVQAGLDWYRLLSATALTPDQHVALHALRRDGRAVAALPLLAAHDAGGATGLRALGNFYTTRFTPPLAADADADDLALLLRDVRAQHPRACEIQLAPMDAQAPAYRLYRTALERAGFVTFEYFCFGNWYLPVATDFDAYLAARPGAVRSTLRRMSRRFAQAGGRIERIGADGDVERAIAAYAAVYARSWKQPEPFPHFMPALIRLCARRGWLRIGIAWLGAEPIAAQLWIVAHGKASIYKLAYDGAHGGLSPGTLLTAELMRHAVQVDGVREVDYLTGDDAYKKDWMTQRRELWGLVGYDPRRWRGAARALGELSGRALKRVLKRAPAPTAPEA